MIRRRARLPRGNQQRGGAENARTSETSTKLRGFQSYRSQPSSLRLSLALGASALHLIQATRYLLKHRPGGDGAEAADEVTCGFVVETRIAKFKSRPPPIPPVPVRIDSSALQTRRDSTAVASVAVRRESTVVPSRRESSVAYPEYL